MADFPLPRPNLDNLDIYEILVCFFRPKKCNIAHILTGKKSVFIFYLNRTLTARSANGTRVRAR
jgi:hypothetical protein